VERTTIWRRRRSGCSDGRHQLRTEDTPAWVEDVFTVPEARGRGHARTLVTHTPRHWRDRRVTTCPSSSPTTMTGRRTSICGSGSGRSAAPGPSTRRSVRLHKGQRAADVPDSPDAPSRMGPETAQSLKGSDRLNLTNRNRIVDPAGSCKTSGPLGAWPPRSSGGRLTG